MAPYNSSMAAVVALSETLRVELEPANVGVSVLCPTFFATDIAKSGRYTPSMQHLHGFVLKMMASGKLSAADVARIALEGVEKNELYVLPHADGRWLWRLKRSLPERFPQLASRAMRAQAKRFGVEL
jgi:short-subunit dehydrogenase